MGVDFVYVRVDLVPVDLSVYFLNLGVDLVDLRGDEVNLLVHEGPVNEAFGVLSPDFVGEGLPVDLVHLLADGVPRLGPVNLANNLLIDDLLHFCRSVDDVFHSPDLGLYLLFDESLGVLKAFVDVVEQLLNSGPEDLSRGHGSNKQ